MEAIPNFQYNKIIVVYNHFKIFLLALVICCTSVASAQIVSGNLFLQGAYLEAGLQRTGNFGSGVNAPSGYHPHYGTPPCGGSTTLASVYDYGLDGWSTGSPPYMGDYTLPGSPYEQWAIQANGDLGNVETGNCGTYSGSLTGNFVSYSNTGGTASGLWVGSTDSGAIGIRKEYKIDTFGSAVIITVVLINNTAAAIPGIYYLRSCDPDNSQTWGGSFATTNVVDYQNDSDHRVLITAHSTGCCTSTSIGLGTKDGRARVISLNSWPFRDTSIVILYTASLGVSAGTTAGGDAGIALIFNIGTLPAHDSTVFSYAYIYNGTAGINAAFPDPQMVVGGVAYDSVDSITVCMSAPDTVPVNIINATSGQWTGSTWAWAPATGLSSTTGISVAVDRTTITSRTIYTITGTDTATSASKTFFLIVDPSNHLYPITGASTVCQGAGITLSDLTSGGVWATTSPGLAVIDTSGFLTGVSPGVDTIYYTKVYPCETDTVNYVINVNPLLYAGALSGPDSLCPGDTIHLATTVAGGSWSGTNAAAATVSGSGRVTGMASGVDTVKYMVSNSCGADTATKVLKVMNASSCTTGLATDVAQVTSLDIYPNPNKGSFAMKLLSGDSNPATVSITNVLGEKIADLVIIRNKETSIRLNVLTGIYFITVTTQHERMYRKLFVE